MNPQLPSKHATIGMPTRTAQNEQVAPSAPEDDRMFAPLDEALAFATALAERNAELMRRLA